MAFDAANTTAYHQSISSGPCLPAGRDARDQRSARFCGAVAIRGRQVLDTATEALQVCSERPLPQSAGPRVAVGHSSLCGPRPAQSCDERQNQVLHPPAPHSLASGPPRKVTRACGKCPRFSRPYGLPTSNVFAFAASILGLDHVGHRTNGTIDRGRMLLRKLGQSRLVDTLARHRRRHRVLSGSSKDGCCLPATRSGPFHAESQQPHLQKRVH